MFAQITKVDEERRLVYGRAVQGGVVDKSDEVFDYATSKPHFQRWSADVSAATGGKSLGNVRSMHGNVAAGKLVDIMFDDHEQAIDVAAKIVDDNEWRKVLEGTYTGFSIGGRYLKRWPDVVGGKSVTRYTATPTEISIVDAPCIPTAKFFDIQKADGTLHRVAFRASEVSMHIPNDENYCGRTAAAHLIKTALATPGVTDVFGQSSGVASQDDAVMRVSKRVVAALAKAGIGIKAPHIVANDIDAIRQIHAAGARKMSPVSLPPQSDNAGTAPTRIHPHITAPKGDQYRTPTYVVPPLFGASPQSASESAPTLPPGDRDEYGKAAFEFIRALHRRGPSRGILR